MKKIRFTISDFMNEIIKSDSEYFKLQIGKIGNIIFNYYIDKNLNKVELEDSSGEVIQFNLNKTNEEIFMDTLIRNKIETEAEYWRNIFFTYINNLRYKREEILFEKNFKNIEKAIKDKKYIDEVYKNFDPFLSYKNRVKVKFTEKGLELYEKVLTNRPRLLNKNNNIYTFECDNKLAMVYFAQFFSLIEILEPRELREKLQNELENTLKIYKNEEEKDV